MAFTISALAMHHIYDEAKQRAIVDFASALNVRELYLFGKPGRVVVLGIPKDVRAYEQSIRRLHWQKCFVMGHDVTDSMEAFTGFHEVCSEEALRLELQRRHLHHVFELVSRSFNARKTKDVVVPSNG